MRKSLTKLANKYGTDKGTIGPSTGWGVHNYTDVYAAYLGRYRNAPITLLEIGLGVTGENWKARIVHGRNRGGASLKMWYDYFSKASIYGIDVNECSYLDNDRITTFVADQGNVDDLAAFMQAIDVDAFDIIIDDGSHRPDDQQISLGFFFKRLRNGGFYLIEDLLSNGLGDGAKGRMACETVRNTRSVLKHYVRSQSFPEPNALVNADYLEEYIHNIRFHAPPVAVKHVLRPSLRKPIERVFSYKEDKESLCVIRKNRQR